MKALFLIMQLIPIWVFAFTAEVKDSQVTLKINDQVKTYNAGQTIELKSGDVICFIDGAGKVLITKDDYKRQISSKNSSCKAMPSKNDDKTSVIIKYASNAVVKTASIADLTSEKIRSGTSRSSLDSESEIVNKDLIVSKNDKFISIASDKWGPLPISLTIYDQNSKETTTLINDDETTTAFLFPANIVKNGYKIKVSNALDDTLLNVNITVK